MIEELSYLFREVLWGNSIDPANNVLNIGDDLLLEISGVHTTPSRKGGHRHPKGSPPRPRQKLITEKHS